MKLFSATQLRAADQHIIESEGIPSDELMERAGALLFQEIDSYFKEGKPPVKIFCGIGNNGGDGLVLARLLLEKKYDVEIFVVNYSEKRSKDFLLNYQRLTDLTGKWPISLTAEDTLPDLNKNDFIVDAIFGIGLNRAIDSWVVNLIEKINISGAFIIAVDMPSGLRPNEAFSAKNAIVHANITLTFQRPKLSFFLPESAKFVGKFKVFDLGLDTDFINKSDAIAELIREPEAKSFYRARDKFSHKGTFGHALLIGGSYGKIGSISLSARATLKSGAGMASVFVPKCGYTILQTAFPEAMVITDDQEKYITNINFGITPSVICFGVGAGLHEDTKNAFKNLLQETEKPMLIDADGLNLLAANKNLLDLVPENSVLTPHPKELERLIGTWKNDFEKLEKVKQFSKKYKLIIVVKGAFTTVVSEEKIYINTTGNPGMATAGSGDVLAGMLTGLISQGYNPLAAAIFGVYLHGKAGDIASRKLGYEALLAGDIIAHIGAAFMETLAEIRK